MNAKLEKKLFFSYNINMKKVSLYSIFIFLFIVELYSENLVSNIDYDKELQKIITDIKVVQTSNNPDDIFFISGKNGRNIGFSSNSSIKLAFNFEKINSIFKLFNVNNSKFILFYDDYQLQIAQQIKNHLSNINLIKISSPDELIKKMYETASTVNGFMFLQNSVFLNIATQRLITTLLIKLKRIIISFGISARFPAILTFMPDEKEFYQSLKDLINNNKKTQLVLNTVKFNLRYAALIQMKFKNEVFKYVKQEI